MPVAFRGVTLVAPGVASYIDDSLATAPVTAAPTAMAVVGKAERGEPAVAVAFRDASSAYAFYGNGSESNPLVDGIVRALNAGAGTVYGVRVGSAKQFIAKLLRSSGSSEQYPIKVTSKEWGRLVKTWLIEISDATKSASLLGAKKVILTTHNGIEQQYIVDNIYKAYLNIQSTDSSTGSCTISNQAISLQHGQAIATKTATNGNLVVGTEYEVAALNGTSQVTWNVIKSGTTAAGSLVAGQTYLIADLGTLTSQTSPTLTSAFTTAGWTAAANGNASAPAVGHTITVATGQTGSGCTGATFTTATSFTVGTIFTAAGTGSTDTAANNNYGTVIRTDATKSYLFSDYQRLGNLIAAISADGLFTVELARGATSGLLTKHLDASTSSQTIPASSDVTPLVLTGNTRAVFDTLSTGVFRALVSVEWNDNYLLGNAEYRFKYYDAQNIDRSSDNTIIDPTITTLHWRSAFAALNDVDISVVTAMTGDDLELAEGMEHVKAMAEPDYSSERIFIMGGPINQTSSEAIAMADSFNHKRAVVCWPGIYDYDRNGDLQLLAPYYLAAQIAGTLTSQPDPSVPLTNKSVKIPALEFVPTRTEVDELINGGVLTLKTDSQRGIIVTQSLTTWTGDLAYAKREISTVRAADRTVRAVRLALRGYIGQKSNKQTLGQIGQAVRETLQFATGQGWITDDPTNPGLYPAYSNISIKPVGDAYYVDFTISPVRPLNYILVTAYVN